jgi:hypothetical protein
MGIHGQIPYYDDYRNVKARSRMPPTELADTCDYRTNRTRSNRPA